MSITINLDTKAVMALISEDEDIRMELRSAVVSNVIKHISIKDVNTIAEHVKPIMFEQLKKEAEFTARVERAIETTANSLVERRNMSIHFSPKVRDELDKACQVFVDQKVAEFSQVARSAAHEYAEKHAARLNDRIDGIIAQRMEQSINEEVNRRVAQRLNDVLTKVAGE